MSGALRKVTRRCQYPDNLRQPLFYDRIPFYRSLQNLLIKRKISLPDKSQRE